MTDDEAPIPRIWLLKLVLPGPWGGIASGLLVFAILMLAFQSTGVFGVEGTPKGVILFFIAILAYMVPVFAWVVRRAAECREQLLPLVGDQDAARRIRFDRYPLRGQIAVVGIGVVAWLVHTLILATVGDLLLTGEGSWFSLVVTAGSFLVWIGVSTFVALLFEYAMAFRRMARDTRIDLFQINQLSPYAQIATTFRLALVGAQAALPLMLIEGFSLVGFLPGWLGLLIPMLILMYLPVWPVHKAIVSVKRAELSRINQIIESRRGELGTDLDKLVTLNPLLAYRREIADVSEWPLDLGFFTRLMLYLLIPPVTWIGAALIENLVELFL